MIKRKFEISSAAQAQLTAAEIRLSDHRLLSARWYLERDTRHDLLRSVAKIADGTTLWAYRTKMTAGGPSLVLYVTVTGALQDVTVVGVMGVRAVEKSLPMTAPVTVGDDQS